MVNAKVLMNSQITFTKVGNMWLDQLGKIIERKELKIIILLVIPFVYGLWLPHVETVKNEHAGSHGLESSNGNNSLDFKSVRGEVSVPSDVNTVFPIAKYLSFWPLVSFRNPEICFEDNGSYVAYTNGTKLSANVDWTVDFNGKNVTLEQNSSNCTAVNFGQKFNYTWTGKLFFLIGKNESLGNVIVVPDTKTYHKFDYDYGILQGLVLIPALYLFFWYPIVGIINKIENGWKEQ